MCVCVFAIYTARRYVRDYVPGCIRVEITRSKVIHVVHLNLHY